MNFLDMPQEYRKKDARFKILPISYEKNLTFMGGTHKGASEILHASAHMEYYEDEFDCEPFEDGIYTHNLLELCSFEEQEAIQEIEKQYPLQGFCISLGGDHACTIGCLKGLEKKEKEFDVIVFDAHPDFFGSWNGSKFNHRCISKQASIKHKVLLVGCRSMDIDERALLDANENVSMITAYDLQEVDFKKELEKLSDNVYISIDVDVFDPSFISLTGTPEPGGMFFRECVGYLKEIFKEKKVLGADIMEFSPHNDQPSQAQAYSLARLAHKLFALKKISKE